MIFACTISVRGGPSVWVNQTMDPTKTLKRGRPEMGVRQISLQINLTQLDAKAAEAGVTAPSGFGHYSTKSFEYRAQADPNIIDIAESATARVRPQCPVESEKIGL